MANIVPLNDLTQTTLDGSGVFDTLMRSMKAHLEAEYQKGRIKGTEYSTVYLGSLTAVLDASLNFLLQREKVALEAELMAQQVLVAQAEVEKARAQVEIAKALAADSKVIIMDEPTASLTSEEVNHLFKIVRQLKEEGKGIVFISHKLGEIIEIGDRVSVLKDGAYVGTRDVKGVTADDLVTMMVGRKIQNTYQHEDAPDTYENTEVIFEVRNLSRKDQKVKNVSFKLHKGEILGFSGLVGSGRSEMMNAIFGSEPRSAGDIFIHGKQVKINSPYSAMKNGLAMVTENRRETGFFYNFDIKQNISILPFIKTSKGKGTIGLTNDKFEKECAEEQKKNLNIKCASVDQNITELSGGNQQKVILGKWLAADSQIIIFDEPTKGIDIGSKSEIYTLMRKLADEGKGVLVVSSELPELLAVCDTIAVFREGKIVQTFPHKDATEEKIIMASTADLKERTN